MIIIYLMALLLLVVSIALVTALLSVTVKKNMGLTLFSMGGGGGGALYAPSLLWFLALYSKHLKATHT